jgi:hypothetical protein
MKNFRITAYFDDIDQARSAQEELRNKGYFAVLDKIEGGLPDPDMSVSALMVGFLPDLAHGIFSDGKHHAHFSDRDRAYLMVLAEPFQDPDVAERIIAAFGGEKRKV